jgi:molecular chaperone GrpE
MKEDAEASEQQERDRRLEGNPEMTGGPEGASAIPDVGAEGTGEVPEEISWDEWKRLQGKAAEADEFRERYLRSVAEFENYRKRSVRDRQEAVQYAQQGFLERLMPVMDNLDMALTALQGASGGGGGDALKTGIEMVFGQLRSVLAESGLEEVPAMGQSFDPTWHEAVSQQETTEVPEGQVLQVLRKGYRLQQRLLRPSTVVVARAPQGSAA